MNTYFDRSFDHCHIRTSHHGARWNVISESFVASFLETDESVEIVDLDGEVILKTLPNLEDVAKAIRDLEIESGYRDSFN